MDSNLQYAGTVHPLWVPLCRPENCERRPTVGEPLIDRARVASGAKKLILRVPQAKKENAFIQGSQLV
jgi:hypothetical protein